MSNTDTYAAARERAKAKYGFYVHLAVFVAVNILLTAINLVTGSEAFWAIWPILGWGFAVAIHALTVFVFPDESRIIDRLTQRELHKHSH